MVKKKKILFFVYCLLVSALSIGWYPQNQNKQVRKDITSVRKSSEKMAALVEIISFVIRASQKRIWMKGV